MSRTGKKVVVFQAPTKVKQEGTSLHFQGQKGELQVDVPTDILIKMDASAIHLECAALDENQAKSLLRSKQVLQNAIWGTVRQHIANAVHGVTLGFQKALSLEGVGFRASVAGHKLNLSIGFSHPVEYVLPPKVAATVEGNTKIVLSSCDKRLLGQVAAEIRALRPPEPYKGKGIKYETEVVRRKAGKTGKK